MSMSDSDRLRFRLEHIIPRSFSYESVKNNRASTASIARREFSNEPEDVEFQMTYGKVAGIYFCIFKKKISRRQKKYWRIKMQQRCGVHLMAAQSLLSTAGWTTRDRLTN